MTNEHKESCEEEIANECNIFFTNIGPVLPKKQQMRQGELKVILKKVDTTKSTDSLANNEIKVVFFH